MNEETFPRRWWFPWGPFVAPWVLFGPMAIGFAYMQLVILGRPVNWTELWALTAVDCSILAGATYLIYLLNLWFPFERQSWRRPLLVHAAAMIVVSVSRSALLSPLYWYFRPTAEKPHGVVEWFQVLFSVQFPSFVIIYWLILGVCLAVGFYQMVRERELRASQLEAQLAQAQLQMLKMQLHPHFLFNTLHAISALMHQDVELADRMIARLGELLRSTLENMGTQLVTVKQELDFIKPYLEIEQARLGPRLTVHMDIDPETMDAQVPNLLLQPLVENAIRHGIAPRTEPGRIEIKARRDNGTLELSVRDDGPGLNGHAAHLKRGIGLGNTEARLRQLYGDGHRFEVRDAPPRGLLATVVIPFQEMNANGPDSSDPRG